MNIDIILTVIITVLICLVIGLALKLRAVIQERDFYKIYNDQIEMQERMFSNWIENPLQERPVFSPPKIVNKESVKNNRGFTQ